MYEKKKKEFDLYQAMLKQAQVMNLAYRVEAMVDVDGCTKGWVKEHKNEALERGSPVSRIPKLFRKVSLKSYSVLNKHP